MVISYIANIVNSAEPLLCKLFYWHTSLCLAFSS